MAEVKDCRFAMLALCAALVCGCGDRTETPAPIAKGVSPPAPVQKNPFRQMISGLSARTPILTYHDVISRRNSRSLWFDCTESELQSQLDWLAARGATFVSLDQVYDHLTSGKPLPEKAVAITFGDGYEGFYLRGWPLLRKRGIPVAMFVHTGFVGNRQGRPKMSWEQLEELDRSGLVTIGSQTVTHPEDLRELRDDELRSEMEKSKSDLETRLGHAVKYLAYPNGKYDERSEAAARVAGYLMAFSEVQQPAELSLNILSVNRYVHTKYRRAWQDAYGG